MAALKRKRPQVLQHLEPKKLCGGKAAPNAQILPQIAPSRQEICLDCNGLRSIGHGRGTVCFCAVQGTKIRPDSPLTLFGPTALGGAA